MPVTISSAPGGSVVLVALETLATTAVLLPACHCESAYTIDTEADGSDGSSSGTATSTWGASGVLPGSSSEGSTGAPFDASRWIGRYHYEYVYADWGDPTETDMLVNFEIFGDSTALMLYDHCSFDVPEIIAYEWTPDEELGWIELHPGAGESSLRILSLENLETLRVHLIEPCRELRFEHDGYLDTLLPFYLGESCWINRCGDGIGPVVQYCEGEEPPPCP